MNGDNLYTHFRHGKRLALKIPAAAVIRDERDSA